MIKAKKGEPVKWLYAHKDAPDGECLIWPFSRSSAGYSTVWFNGGGHSATNIMCRLAHGEPPSPQHEGAHSCGNGRKGCLHPKHIRWATRRENSIDRSHHGSKVTKLSPTDIPTIRMAISKGETTKTVGKVYGVHKRTIKDIMIGRTWSHIP